MNSNDYKYKRINKMMGERGKRGQLAIFVIIAIVIVAIILVIALYPRIRTAISGDLNPNTYLKDCISPSLESTKLVLNKQGGYSNPTGFFVLDGEKIKYLCYTNENYDTCVVQEAMIKSHYEQELNRVLNNKANECARSLKTEYEKRGYSVNQGVISSKVEIVPNQIQVNYRMPLTVSKNDESSNFNNLKIEVRSEMYDLLLISQSIVEFESVYGDSSTEAFLQYYPDLKIEKLKLSEGTKIYTVSNVITKEEFRFASRSLSWPPGYGVIE